MCQVTLVVSDECCIYCRGRSQDFRKGGANLLVYDYITRAKKLYPEPAYILQERALLQRREFSNKPSFVL